MLVSHAEESGWNYAYYKESCSLLHLELLAAARGYMADYLFTGKWSQSARGITFRLPLLKFYFSISA